MTRDEIIRALMEGPGEDATLAQLDNLDAEHRGATLTAIDQLVVERILSATDCPPSKNRFDIYDRDTVAGLDIPGLLMGLLSCSGAHAALADLPGGKKKVVFEIHQAQGRHARGRRASRGQFTMANSLGRVLVCVDAEAIDDNRTVRLLESSCQGRGRQSFAPNLCRHLCRQERC